VRRNRETGQDEEREVLGKRRVFSNGQMQGIIQLSELPFNLSESRREGEEEKKNIGG
jgi:hypothetical protein